MGQLTTTTLTLHNKQPHTRVAKPIRTTEVRSLLVDYGLVISAGLSCMVVLISNTLVQVYMGLSELSYSSLASAEVAQLSPQVKMHEAS